MTYEEFVEKLIQSAQEELGYDPAGMDFYPEGYDSTDPTVRAIIEDLNLKYTGKESGPLAMDFLLMRRKNTEVSAEMYRIATRRMYKRYQKEGFDAVFKTVKDELKNLDASQIDPGWIKKRISGDYEQIREQLIIRPLNYDLHIADLKGHVYRKIDDFVLALYYLVGDANHSLTTSKIYREEMKLWGVKEEQVIQDALANTARLYPAVIFDRRTQKEENLMEKEFSREDVTLHVHTDMIMVSARGTPNGAVSIFYPGVIEKMMKIMGGPFQAVFMNIRDVLIFDMKDRNAVNYLKQAKEGSSTIGEMLSGKIYRCDEKGLHAGTVVQLYPNGKYRIM
ncbi:MAG: hypothetical protein IJ088_09850 [Clostridia bacterium]|nr:hypothetical protein [Clostridia bacterium]